jgi:hypothetical protein
VRADSESRRRDSCDMRVSRYEYLELVGNVLRSGLPFQVSLEALTLFVSPLRWALEVYLAQLQIANMYGKVFLSINCLN